MLAVALMFLAAQRWPALFTNLTYMGGLVAVEVVLACIWQFEKVFLPVTIGCFLLAGTGLPLAGASTTLRWLFLATGGLFGLLLWMKSNRAQHFGLFHLVALFCVFAAIASASASEVPETAMLKVLSLFLLFLYAATGGRVAVANREEHFFRGLILACEILVYVVSAGYLALGYNVFGNPNALGAVIGVAVVPVMLWAALLASTARERQRRMIALALCGVLLYASVCRAAILADAVLVVVLAIALRRPRLLLKTAFVGALFLEVMAVANPAHMVELTDSLTGKFIFKTQQGNKGIFGSRQTPWDETVSSVKQHPWFGSGFGTTSGLGGSQFYGSPLSTTDAGSNREHGSSYLALAEYMGLLGIAPFLLLLLLLIRAAVRVYRWMRARGPYHYAVPLAMIVLAGLVHAGFEDWLFAVGSYLSVFFWVSAFLLVDLCPGAESNLQVSAVRDLAPFAQSLALEQPPR
jgi:O-antigen ligase